MATIQRYLSQKIDQCGCSQICLRVSIGRGRVFRIKSGLAVKAERFRDGRIIKPKANQKEASELRALESELAEIESALLDYCISHPDAERDNLDAIVRKHHDPTFGEDPAFSFFAVFDEYTNTHEMAKNRADSYRSLARALHRFETHRRLTEDKNYRIELDAFSADDIAAFVQFYRDEWKLYDEFPNIYLEYPVELRMQHKTHRPQKRGENIIITQLRKLRAFFNWCLHQDITANRPFEKYALKSERYGTPYYLTLEERDQLAEHDFSDRPKLAIQRDIFIFQCLIGCRVSDLTALTQANIIDGAIEYVAQKTKRESAEVVRVPLNQRAKDILRRYASGGKGTPLLPFICDQRYNDSIKEMLRLAGIDRMVTVINPKTGEDEQRHIYEVASSHMARRTFIGNIYKKVKDPLLVSSLTGHRDGSKAFQRYRNIDDDIKRGLVGLIE